MICWGPPNRPDRARAHQKRLRQNESSRRRSLGSCRAAITLFSVCLFYTANRSVSNQLVILNYADTMSGSRQQERATDLMELFFKSEGLDSLIRSNDASLACVFECLSTCSMRVLLLQRSAAIGEVRVLRHLLSLALVDPNEFCMPNVAAEGNFEHLIHTAVRYRQVDCLKALLEELADVNLQSSYGSVLHEACVLNDAQTVKLLLVWEASPEVVFNDLTPFEAAVLVDSREAASLMNSKGSLFASEQGVEDARSDQKQREAISPPLSGFIEYFRRAMPRFNGRVDRSCSYFAEGSFVSISNSEGESC